MDVITFENDGFDLLFVGYKRETGVREGEDMILVSSSSWE